MLLNEADLVAIDSFLAELRNRGALEEDAVQYGTLRSWDGKWIDAARQRFGDSPGDVELLVRLLRSTDPAEVETAHAIGRRVVRRSAAVADALNQAYQSVRGNVRLALSIAHDLMEYEAWLIGNRESFAEYITANEASVREAVLTFMGNSEAELVDTFGSRLRDVLGGTRGSTTMNHPGKAFAYLLYLGLVTDPGVRASALSLVEGLPDSSMDDFTRQVRTAVVVRLQKG